MRLATEERTHEEPVRASGGSTRLGGTDIFRGALVIVTAIVIGGFLISRGVDTTTAGDELTSPDTSVVETATIGSEDEAAGIEEAGGVSTTPATATDEAPVPAPVDTTDPAAVPEGEDGEVLPEDTVPEAPVLRPPAEVKVLVLNAAQTQGIAARGTEALLALNYTTGAPKNANSRRPSAILYTESYQPEALAVAAVFGPGLESLVQPLDPADPPIDDTQQANVIVVIGPDDLIPIP